MEVSIDVSDVVVGSNGPIFQVHGRSRGFVHTHISLSYVVVQALSLCHCIALTLYLKLNVDCIPRASSVLLTYPPDISIIS